jgi:hypothetical protein
MMMTSLFQFDDWRKKVVVKIDDRDVKSVKNRTEELSDPTPPGFRDVTKDACFVFVWEACTHNLLAWHTSKQRTQSAASEQVRDWQTDRTFDLCLAL